MAMVRNNFGLSVTFSIYDFATNLSLNEPHFYRGYTYEQERTLSSEKKCLLGSKVVVVLICILLYAESHKPPTIQIMAEHTGVRNDFFKEGEGELGDGICALYDKPGSNLRLYFIRFGDVAIVLGGGGHKPKNIRRFQENSKLKDENYLLRKISSALNEAIQDGSLLITDDGFESLTDFTYTIEEDEQT